MIYLKDGNIPLNEAWADEIYQEGNSTYQLTFKYPFSSDKWKLLTEETELIADDLDGEQEFTIFEVVKEQGYITVYANQIATLLKSHSISSINVDRVDGNVVMTALAGAILRDCPFSFYSDITDKHTFNAANISVMDALIKEKHSIVGQWGGDLVRDKYQVSLLKNGGSETEALFMYKKNMRSTQQTTSTKELRTRIHFRKKIVVGEGDNRKEQWLRVTVDSPLINKYKHIYEADMEVTDEDVKDLDSLTKYGEQYYRTTLCDMIEDSLELDVAGIGDVPVKIFDVVSVYHEQFGMDVRKKITKYRYSPMGKKLKSVGFGTIQQTLGGALNAMVSDSVKAETATIEQNFEVKLEKELKNADKVFDQKMNQMEQSLSDEIEQARAKAEEVKAAMTEQLNLKINQSKSEVTEHLKSDFDRKLANAQNELAGVRANLTQAQNQLSGNISQIRSDVGAIRNQQTVYEQSNAQNLARITGQLADKASKTEVKQTADGIREELASLSVGGRNLIGAFNTHCVKSTFDIDTYRFSGKTEKNTNTTSLQLQFMWEDGSYTSVASINALGAFKKAFKIKKPYREFIIKFNSNKEDAKLICRDSTLLKLNEGYLFTGILSKLSSNDSVAEYLKIEKGTLPSDWSPALEDTEGQITEAKATFERTAQGLRTDLSAVQAYVNSDGTRAEALRTYSREETARQLTALRQSVESGYVAKAQHTEDVRSISRRFEELRTGASNLLLNTGFNKISDVNNVNNPILKLNQNDYNGHNSIEVTVTGQNKNAWKGITLNASISGFKEGDTIAVRMPIYIFSDVPINAGLALQLKNHSKNKSHLFKDLGDLPRNKWHIVEFLHTFNNDADFEGMNFFYLYSTQNGHYKIAEPSLTLSNIIPSSWTPAPEDATSYADTKLAEYRQTVDGQFATMSSQIGESLRKTDISITPGQITLGTGKVVNGQTLASLFVQNPESMQAITKLMRITGDLIVDGSITGRNLAAGAITTPHLAAGAVTAEVLGANAVTADKVKADDALLEKLTAGEALLRKLMAKDAFVNRLQSIDFTAEQIKGGLLRSIDGSLIFDLNKNTLTMSSNTAAIKRVLPGHPTQFMRYETERKGNVDYTRTIIGSNRNGSEKFDSVTFAGLVVENSNKAGIEDSLRLYGDNTYFRHAQGEVGWNINAVTQRIAPATWQKESAVWARNFVVPKHRNPNGRDWVKLEETVAALWRLWEHAAGNQVTMTGAMRDKVRELFQNYGYNYGIS